jgi:hypothetical protein
MTVVVACLKGFMVTDRCAEARTAFISCSAGLQPCFEAALKGCATGIPALLRAALKGCATGISWLSWNMSPLSRV